MKLFISPIDNKIYTSESLDIQCFTEYRHYFPENIPAYQIENNISTGKNIDTLFLIANTHIHNLWHLMHHLFITYKAIHSGEIHPEYIYPIFFKGFYAKNNNNLESIYKDLLFTGMGLNYEKYLELQTIFLNSSCVEVKNVYISKLGIQFHKEPLLQSFKEYIMKNMRIEYNCLPYEKRITFILRRGAREIMNIEQVKYELSKLPTHINYIYLEDHSIKEQIRIVSNTHFLIGVHGAGLTWAIFMKPNSILLELFPGSAFVKDYSNWCNIASIQYNTLGVNIKEGTVENFRTSTVILNSHQIGEIKRNCLIYQ